MADAVAAEALSALRAAVLGLLPAAVPDGLTRRLRVQARAVRLLGMGGYVGQHVEPSAALHGRRVAARIELDVDGGNDADAADYAATLSGQILGSTRREFVQSGIQRIRGVDATGARALAFDIDFEYVPVPVTGEGVITELALGSYANVTPYRTRGVADFGGASLVLLADPLADFVPATDPLAAPAAAWSASAAPPAALVQTAASIGGPLDLSAPDKAGAHLLWRPQGVALNLARFVFGLSFTSAGPDGIGIVFAHRAGDEYFYYLASARNGYQLFGRRRPSGFQTLASSGGGFATALPQRLVLTAFDQTLSAEIDGQRSLTVMLALPPGSGEIGLFTHGNDTARFTAGRLMELVAV